MVDYLLHAYRKGTRPFQSLCTIPEQQALALMESLYVEGAIIWERFKDPRGYLSFRKQVEQTMRNAFIEKGGLPKEQHPVYLVLGRPRWIAELDELSLATISEIRVPLSIVNEQEVSFTYPDSMVSALMAAEKNPEYYEPEYHGKVFTLREVEQIVRRKGLPGEQWQTRMPGRYAHYIEAQLWNREALASCLEPGVEYPG